MQDELNSSACTIFIHSFILLPSTGPIRSFLVWLLSLEAWTALSNGKDLMCKSAAGRFDMGTELFNKDELPAAGLSYDTRGARPGKGIEHHISRARIRFNDRLDCEYRLFIGVILVAGVFPWQEIWQGIGGSGWSTLGEKKSRFMEAPGISLARAV